MAFRPLIAGILSSGVSTGPAQITMGALDSRPYFLSAQAASDFEGTQTGSATGDLSADGGTIEGLGQADSSLVILYILGGNGTNPLNVNIDGTDYTANREGLFNGYQVYGLSGSIFTIGNTYTVIIT